MNRKERRQAGEKRRKKKTEEGRDVKCRTWVQERTRKKKKRKKEGEKIEAILVYRIFTLSYNTEKDINLT